MEKLKLMICGTEYILATDEDEGYMRAIASHVEKSMKAMMDNPRISLSMAAVLAALNGEDRAEKALKAADHLRAQMKEYLDDHARIRAEADR